MPDASTRILLFNTGYCTGLDGSLREYLLGFFRYFYTPKKTFNRVLGSIDDMVDTTQPDLCCFLEVRKVTRFVQKLWEYPFHQFENKYGMHSILRKIPFFRKNSIGFFSQESLPFQKHYFRHGVKKLLYEVRLSDDVSLIIGHLSLTRRARKKQLAELKELIKKRKHVILCGDFNVFRGIKELTDIIQECRLKVVNTLSDKTFPAANPKKALDLFLCSEDLPIEDLQVLDSVQASDHLPVLLELKV